MSSRILSGVRRNWTSLVGLLLLIVAGPMCGSGGGGGGGGGGTPVTFTVIATNPVDASIGACRTATIFVLVNGVADQLTVTPANITVTGAAGIPITAAWNNATNMIEITPSGANAWDGGAQNNIVSLSAGIKTLGGTPLTPFTFAFQAAAATDIVRPSFGGLTSITAPTTSQVTLNWTQGTDGVSPQASLVYDVYLSLTTAAQNFSNPPSASVTGTGTITLTLGTLNPATMYFFVVRCRDQAGNHDLNTTEIFKKTLTSFNTNIYQAFIVPICQQCHAPAPAMASFMDLTGGPTAARLQWVDVAANAGTGPSPAPSCGGAGNIRVIITGGPDAPNSLVYRKLSQNPPSCGVRMPEGLPPLPAGQIQAIFDWITEGGLNN